jgi:hypothetical protein
MKKILVLLVLLLAANAPVAANAPAAYARNYIVLFHHTNLNLSVDYKICESNQCSIKGTYHFFRNKPNMARFYVPTNYFFQLIRVQEIDATGKIVVGGVKQTFDDCKVSLQQEWIRIMPKQNGLYCKVF